MFGDADSINRNMHESFSSLLPLKKCKILASTAFTHAGRGMNEYLTLNGSSSVMFLTKCCWVRETKPCWISREKDDVCVRHSTVFHAQVDLCLE